jgi:hypothetical protein
VFLLRSTPPARQSDILYLATGWITAEFFSAFDGLYRHRGTNTRFVGFSVVDVVAGKPQLLPTKRLLERLLESGTTETTGNGNRTADHGIAISTIPIRDFQHHDRDVPLKSPPELSGDPTYVSRAQHWALLL